MAPRCLSSLQREIGVPFVLLVITAVRMDLSPRRVAVWVAHVKAAIIMEMGISEESLHSF